MPTAAGTTPNTLSPPDATNASTAASSAAAGEVSGYLTVRYKGGKKTRWKRKHAVLRQDTIYLADEQVCVICKTRHEINEELNCKTAYVHIDMFLIRYQTK